MSVLIQSAVGPPASGDDSQKLSTTSGSRSSLRSRSKKETHNHTHNNNNDGVAVINDRATTSAAAHPTRTPRGSRRTRVLKALDPSPHNSDEGEALEKEPRGASRQEDRIEHFDLNIPQTDASSISDMSMTDDENDHLSVDSMDGKPPTRTKEARSSSSHRFSRENPSSMRKNLSERRSLGRDNKKKSAHRRFFSTEEVRPGLLDLHDYHADDLHDYHADDLLRDHKAVGIAAPNTPPMKTIKNPLSAFPERIVRRVQSEKVWNPRLSDSDDGIPKVEMKEPSPENVDVYLTSSEWTGQQRIKDELREVRKEHRERSPRTRATNIPSPGLATYLSEINLGASALESSIHLSSRRISMELVPPKPRRIKAATPVQLDAEEVEQIFFNRANARHIRKHSSPC
jgi:hypothetical protein